MRTFIILTIILYSSINCGAQTSFNRLYSEYPGYIIWDLAVSDSINYALASDFYLDEFNTGNNYLLVLNVYGKIIDKIELTEYIEGSVFNLFIDGSNFYALIQKHNPSNLRILKGDLDNHLWELSQPVNLPGVGEIVGYTWTFKSDSIVLIINKPFSIGNTQIVKYSIPDFQNMPSHEEMISYNGLVKNIIPYSKVANSYLLMATGLDLLDSNFQFMKHLAKDTIYGINGQIVEAIDSGYITFSKIYEPSQPGNEFIGLCYLNPELSVQNYSTIAVLPDESFLPAINTCLSKDSNSYFIACHKDIESSLYTDTIKHLYYLGKFDKDLNQVWLKILGGDRKYLIAGVKADGQGGCYVHGMTRLWEYNYTTIPFLMRFNADGEITADQDPLSEPEFEFTILGNPGHDWFRYEFDAKDSGYVLKILDVQGREMAVRHLETGFGQVSVANWPAGVYIFQLFSPEGSSFQGGKWIKG